MIVSGYNLKIQRFESLHMFIDLPHWNNSIVHKLPVVLFFLLAEITKNRVSTCRKSNLTINSFITWLVHMIPQHLHRRGHWPRPNYRMTQDSTGFNGNLRFGWRLSHSDQSIVWWRRNAPSSLVRETALPSVVPSVQDDRETHMTLSLEGTRSVFKNVYWAVGTLKYSLLVAWYRRLKTYWFTDMGSDIEPRLKKNQLKKNLNGRGEYFISRPSIWRSLIGISGKAWGTSE